MPVTLEVQGGHYRTAVTCLAGKPVGLTGHDTAAYAEADVEGEIDFNLQATPAMLRIVWHDMPAGARLELIGPDNQIREGIDAIGDSEHVSPLNDSGSWRLRANASRQLRAAGGSGRGQYSAQSIVFISLQ
jgi:hypothetical protein